MSIDVTPVVGSLERCDGHGEGAFELFFTVNDSGGKGFWSAADVDRLCKRLWKQDCLLPPPYAFHHEVFRQMKRLAHMQGAADATGVAQDRLTLEEARLSWAPFKAKRHNIFRRWAMARSRSIFACPCCQGHFCLRLDDSGQEVAAVSSTGTPGFRHACPSSAAGLLPLSSEVSRLHDGVASAVAGGASVVTLPPGSARPLLIGRLLLEFSSDPLDSAATLLVASESHLRGVASFLAAQAPRRALLWLQRDGWSPQALTSPPLLLSTPEALHETVSSGTLRLADVGLALCSCLADEVPPVCELRADAPLSALGAGPRTVCLLDGRSSVHQALAEHVDAVKAAQGHLDLALRHLQVAESAGTLGTNPGVVPGGSLQQLILEATVSGDVGTR